MEELTPITDDVYQLRLPLPFALNSVNCYLLRGDSGWTLIDTGLNLPPARAAWQQAFDTLQIGPGQVTRLVLTHTHPDHYGLAGWLQEQWSVPVWLSRREAQFARQVWQEEDLPAEVPDLFELGGAPAEVGQAVAAGTDQIRAVVRPHPARLDYLEPGMTLDIGRRRFEVLLAPGHADGQLIFYDPADRLLLCADHVLAHISPNISRWPLGEPDPLGQYLNSLAELKQLPVRLALPGHGPLISTWAERLVELQAHHVERLAATRQAVEPEGSTPYEVCTRLFESQSLSAHEMRFALAETLAHLEYLAERGQLRREQGPVWRYWAQNPSQDM
jgi:glyoxylase-like metal-dependent hydrolase (beta-lactamase superfamily II)